MRTTNEKETKMMDKKKLTIGLLCIVALAGWSGVADAANIAPDATATAENYESNYYPSNINDLAYIYHMDHAWVSKLSESEPTWFQLEWAGDVTFREVRLFNLEYATPYGDVYNLVEFKIKIWENNDWTVVKHETDGSSQAIYTFTSGTDLTTSKIRVDVIDACTADSHARLIEMEVDTIPEPATLSLLGLGGIVALIRRRR